MTTIRFHKNDLPDLTHYDVDAVAIDTETLGLNPHRDRLCVVQISPGDGTADVIQIAPGQKRAPNLVALLKNRKVTKLFHYGRFDIAVLYAPKLLTGFRVELLEEEQLVLVKTPGKDGEPQSASDYVYVDWGPMFAAQHGGSSGAFGAPGLMVGLGPLGLSYILRAGGMGYFRKGAVAPHIEAGELELVVGAPEFTYPAYAVYAEAGEGRADVQDALECLKQVVK